MLAWLDIPEGTDPGTDWIIKKQRFRVGDQTFRCTYGDNRADDLHLKKPPALVESYASFLARYPDANLIELGISQGGGLALTHLLARPRQLVGVELDPEPVPALERFIASQPSPERIRTHYGVDQGDAETLRQIVDDAFGADDIDLVFDDASHLLEPTRVSFDVLFPRIRPGGAYVIEDWSWQHLMADRYRTLYREPETTPQQKFAEFLAAAIDDPHHPWHEHALAQVQRHWAAVRDDAPVAPLEPEAPANPDRPLSDLVIQLFLALVASPGVIARIDITELWVLVERGPEPLDRDDFRLAGLYEDFFGQVR